MTPVKPIAIVCLAILLTSFSSAQSDNKDAKKRAAKEAQQYEKERFKKLLITSNPLGARVEINGQYMGVTPYSQPVEEYVYKGAGSFLWSKYLSTPVSLTISKEGFVAKTVVLTNGPFNWYDMSGQLKKVYYVIKAPEFHFNLDRVGDFLGANPFAENKTTADTSMPLVAVNSGNPALSTEEIVQRALPAVVMIRSADGLGSGFFILPSGVIVTNKHVVGQSRSVTVITAKGESLTSQSIFVHPTKDLALVKVDDKSFPFLQLCEPSAVQVGSEVIAIGSPVDSALRNTVTKGIVSAFRSTSEAGTFVQTDAAINPGNSGGPLLNKPQS